MSPLELLAASFGVISVYLSARENILSWPTALVNVGLYTIVFFEARLYADMGLQVVYFTLSLYGWYEWKFGGENRSVLRVSRATTRLWLILAGLNLAAWLTLGSILSRSTDAAIPWLDSLLTTTSLCAQWMMTRKILENWVLWIVLDIVYVPTFISRGLYATAALYAIFLVLAVLGWREWKRSLTVSVAPRPVEQGA
ncbi:MAG: nicotinamide riboside transporter PnuC [Gemmatimonadaceae bacterium]